MCRNLHELINILDSLRVSSSDLEKCSIASVSRQWVPCSEWVPSEWESKQLRKHHNNPHHFSPSVNIWRRQKLRVCKKQIHQDVFLTLNRLKYESITTLPPVKKGSGLNQERTPHSSKQMCVDFDMDFISGGSVMDSGLIFCPKASVLR